MGYVWFKYVPVSPTSQILWLVQRIGKLSYENNCEFDNKVLTFLPVLVRTKTFIFKCGGKSDLTSDDLVKSTMTSKCQYVP